jgi:hypothetical protein
MKHPNASVSTVAAMLAAGTVWLLDRYAHAHLSAKDGVAIAGAYSAVALFVGRRGLRATLLELWRGSKS